MFPQLGFVATVCSGDSECDETSDDENRKYFLVLICSSYTKFSFLLSALVLYAINFFADFRRLQIENQKLKPACVL